MIKYNNKEQFQHTGTSPHHKVFKQYLPRQLIGAKMARRSISQESILQTANAQQGFHPQKRSKSFKINPERTHAAARMRTQILDKRQHKSKAALLLILPIQGNQLGNINPNGFSSHKPLPPRKEDTGLGKMKLLAHKSKLRPIVGQNRHKIQVHQQFLSPRWRHHRFAGEIDPKRLLRIHAIQPQQNNSLQLRLKPPRKLTEPSLETAEEFYETFLAYKSSIYDKPNFQAQEEKGQVNFKSKRKFYLQQLRQGKMRVYGLGRPLRTPFETYYYRHMLWKINFSNKLFIQPPLQYQHRLRAFIGKGNNSPMVRGLLARRYWFAITDHLEDAHFVWTQLKQLSYFSTQKSFNPPNIPSSSSSTYKGSILLSGQEESVSKYLESYRPLEEFSDERLLGRLKNFKYDLVIKGDKVREGRVHNHLIHNYVIGNKKSLFRLMSGYYKAAGKDPFQYIPLTYHIGGGLQDPRFLAFQRYYHTQTRLSRQGLSSTANYWIVKPGENSNRGTGIKVCLNLSQIKEIIKQNSSWGDGSKRTYILQSYIDKPLLYQKRKFDIRHYVLISCVNGCVKGYWYAEGYVRTASFQYNLGSNSASIHLTNDAIQKWLPGYGKFQKGNKISYQQLDAYLLKKKKGGFYSHIFPQMKDIAIDMIRASAALLDPMRLGNNFQLFGLDFMVDQSFKVWLIEANSNPCLELSCPLLAGLIPRLIENLFELALDPIFPPPVRYCPKIPRYSSKLQELNRFQLVFDDRIEAPSVLQDVLDDNLIHQQQEEFQEEQNEQWQDQL